MYLPKVQKYRKREFESEMKEKKFETVLVLFEKDKNLLM
jgi:hypothetical protein